MIKEHGSSGGYAQAARVQTPLRTCRFESKPNNFYRNFFVLLLEFHILYFIS